ncbi:MAG: SET domain-containing protein-lysine N-methyltransferase [Elusimicrobiota bacterium]
MAIKIKLGDDAVKAISPREFFRLFGVRYRRTLLAGFKLPDDFIAAGQALARAEENKMGPIRAREIKRWLAADRAPAAPTYIARVSAAVGYGLYAHRAIAAGRILGEYAGALSRDWTDDFRPYLMKYPFDSPFAVDAQEAGNELRFINHSSKGWNVQRVRVFHAGLPRVIFAAAKPIGAGGQILLDYGKNYWRLSPRPKIGTSCSCRTARTCSHWF